MKKFFCDNRLAKVLLCMSSCHTITVGPFVLSRRKEERLTQDTRNHECTHVRQWAEMSVVCGLLVWVLMLSFDLSPWWLALSGLAFYLWYGLEWLVRLACLGDAGEAYRSISLEREAYGNEGDANYLENSSYFAWLKYL